MATAQMTLTANGSDLLCRLICGGKQDLPGVFRVVEIDDAMADIAIQADRRKGAVLSIDKISKISKTSKISQISQISQISKISMI